MFSSATKGEGGYVFTPLCLSICLHAGSLKNLSTDTDEIWWVGSVCDKDKEVRFW